VSSALEAFEAHAARLLSIDEATILARAIQVAVTTLDGVRGASDERSFEQAVSLAFILLDYNLDIESIVFPFVFWAFQSGEITLDQVCSQIGDGASCLLKAYSRLCDLRPSSTELECDNKASLRRIIVGVSDVRVLFIWLLDQLSLMRILRSYPESQRRAISQRTMKIHVPLAERLGLFAIRAELEDLAFQALDSAAYDEIASILDAKRPKYARWLENAAQRLYTALVTHGLEIGERDISSRQKSYYSIHLKMLRSGLGAIGIHDRLGMRVCVGSIPDCYRALGVVHSLWAPLPELFDDYIKSPPHPGIQALHTAIQFQDGDLRDVVEIQICTREASKRDDYRIHWRYKEQYWEDPELDDLVSSMHQRLEYLIANGIRRTGTFPDQSS